MSHHRILVAVLGFVLSFFPALAGGVAVQLTHQLAVLTDEVSLDAGGASVYGASNDNLGGTNPEFRWQLDRWDAATGAGSVVAAPPGGARTNRAAVSDDGQWLAYLSRGNPTGQNTDGSSELFLMRTDGSLTRQLTNTSGGGGDVLSYALSGSANRVAFVAANDPFGTNPARVPQLFVVDADGTGLRQLTTTSSVAGFDFSISDDGNRIAFEHAGDLTGGNPDLHSELFAILADGTGLRQITATPGTSESVGVVTPRLSGNGARIAFASAETITGQNPTQGWRIWTIDWAGTNLKPITPIAAFMSAEPSITDDGLFVVYASYDPNSGANIDGSREIFKIRYDGTLKTQLTNTTADSGCGSPEIAGGGTRIAFLAGGPIGGLNLDGGRARMVMDGAGGNLRLLVEEHGGSWDSFPDMTADGTRVVFTSGRDPFGTNPSGLAQIFRLQADGTGLAQVTSITEAQTVAHARITDDGQTIVFTSNANPTGTNPNHRMEPFAVRADGTGLLQLTPTDMAGISGTAASAVSGNGAWVVFQSLGDPTGANPDHSGELFRVRPDGTGLSQVTDDDDSIYKLPRIDASGTWVAYASALGGTTWTIQRIRTDGTGGQTIASFDSWQPDISGDGNRVAFISQEDPFGTNPDGSPEVFVWDAATSLVRQVTSFPSGDVQWLRLSRDGAFLAFATSASVFEPNIGEVLQPYRLEIATGTIERIGALGADVRASGPPYGEYVAIDGTGRRLAYTTGFDTVGRNSDGSSEVFFVDLDDTPQIRVGKDAPTIVSWDADPHAIRYDIVRGDVANLAISAGTVDLGAVVCLADGLPMLRTTDPEEPAPGQAFFYVLRGTQGADDGPGSYGQGTGGLERVPSSADCIP